MTSGSQNAGQGNAADVGLHTSVAVATPDIFASDGSRYPHGQFFFGQLVNWDTELYFPFGVHSSDTTSGEFWLDNQWPYNNPQDATPADSGIAESQVFDDTPELTLTKGYSATSASVQSYLRIYLMYQPPSKSGKRTQIVTLEAADWNWIAHGDSNDYATWYPDPPGKTSTTGWVWTDEHPHWNTVYGNKE